MLQPSLRYMGMPRSNRDEPAEGTVLRQQYLRQLGGLGHNPLGGISFASRDRRFGRHEVASKDSLVQTSRNNRNRWIEFVTFYAA